MADKDKTQKQLITELTQLRQRIAELETSVRQHKKTEEEKVAVLDTISEHVVYQDRGMRVLWANRAACESVGVDLQKLVGSHCYEIWPRRRKPCVGCPVAKARKSGQPQEAEIATPDGKVWFIRGYPVRDTKGNITGVIEVTLDITERKQVEDTLRETSLFLRSILDSSASISIVFTDLEQNILFWNKGAENIFGYKAKEVVNRRTVEILYPDEEDTRQTVEEIRSFILNKKRGLQREIKEVTKAGRILWISLTSTPRFDEHGNVIGIVGIGEDITNRKQAERALQESEERFRKVVETMEVGLGAIDEKGVLTYVNEYLAKMVGYSIDEMIGRPTIDFYYHEEGRKIQEEIFKKRRAGLRDTRSYEVIWRSKDGQKVYSILSPTPQFDADGHYTGSFAIHTDITERKRTEEALRESAEKYRAITSGLMDGFSEIDREGHFVDVNEESCSMSGYSRDEHLTMSVSDTEAIETQEETKKRLQKISKTGSDRFESRLRRKDGRIIDIEVSCTYFPQTDHFLIFHRDITDRKQAEQELHHNYQQMQKMLVTTVKALASTVEMKDQYTAGHQPRVTELACAIAEEMGLPEERIEGIRMAGIVHDIGKIIVPAEILNKPGSLTDIQYEMVKMHPRAGFDILKGINFPWPVAEIVLQHQELMDGSGYPQGLSGEEIMLEARILTVANVVEAMVSHRPYRAAYDIQEVLAEIAKNKGILYDPVVVDACLKLFAERRFTFD